MTEAEVLAMINDAIVANGNNEITANILRPILVSMLEQPNDKIGELANLNTTDKTNIVNAINEVLSSSSNTFEIHSGANNPNTTPPASYSIGDWYIRSGSSLYQYNGEAWVLLSSSSTISDTESFLSTEGQTVFTLSTTPVNVDVWVNDVYQQLGYAYTFSGNTVTLNDPIPAGDRVAIRKYEQNISGSTSNPPIQATYANLAALIAAQASQLTGYVYRVLDGSTVDAGITGELWVNYLGTTAGTYEDYSWEPRTASSTPTATAETGTVIDLSNVIGTYYNMSSADTNATYTYTGEVLGGIAFKLINTETVPVINGATKINRGVPFLSNSNMYLTVQYNGIRVEYWFEDATTIESLLTKLPYGNIINSSDNFVTDFFGTPFIYELSTGEFIISHDVFGADSIKNGHVFLYKSTDGVQKTLLYEFNDSQWASFFEHSGNLYMIYVKDFDSNYANGDLAMRYSKDYGSSWSDPITLIADDGLFNGFTGHGTKAYLRDGYIVLGVNRYNGAQYFSGIQISLLYGDITDLTNPSNWVVGSWVSFNGASLPTYIWTNTTEINTPNGGSVSKGHLEPCYVHDGANTYIHCRLEQTPNANYSVYYNVAWDSGNPPASVISTTPNYHKFGGGNVKHDIIWDSISSKFWAITNYNRIKYFSNNRTEFYLMSSSNMVDWIIHSKVAGYNLNEDWEQIITRNSVSYASFVIKGDDIYIASRTATQKAINNHDTDALSIILVENFRTIPQGINNTSGLLFDENSDRIEINGNVSVIYDQTDNANSAYRPKADINTAPAWIEGEGLRFQGSQYLRIQYNENLTIDKGFTFFIVLKNVRSTGNLRLFSYQPTGKSDDIQTQCYFMSPTGFGVEGCRSVYSDFIIGDSMILAYAFDPINNQLWSYKDGANRGLPPTIVGGSWSVDHINNSVAFTANGKSELYFGARRSPSLIGLDSDVIHVEVKSFQNSATINSYIATLNAIYSIY